MGWYENQKARHDARPNLREALAANKAEQATKHADKVEAAVDSGKLLIVAREGEMWKLVSGETVVIRHTARWKLTGLSGAKRVKVKIKGVDSGKRMEVLASQLRPLDDTSPTARMLAAN